jgi:hypothetical protein
MLRFKRYKIKFEDKSSVEHIIRYFYFIAPFIKIIDFNNIPKNDDNSTEFCLDVRNIFGKFIELLNFYKNKYFNKEDLVLRSLKTLLNIVSKKLNLQQKEHEKEVIFVLYNMFLLNYYSEKEILKKIKNEKL